MFFKNSSTISASDLKIKLQNSGSNLLLLDIREKSELTSDLGHLEGIVHIPLGELEANLNKLKEYENKDIIVICRSGARAQPAARTLTKAGFSNVYILEGGMMAFRSHK